MFRLSYSKEIWLKAASKFVQILIVLLIIIYIILNFELSNERRFLIFIIFAVGYLFYPLSQKLTNMLDKYMAPYINKIGNQYKSGKKGEEGEDTVYKWLKEIIQEGEVFRNVTLPGHKSDIDFVVVISKGVIAVEVKNLTNKTFLADDGGFFKIKDNQRIPLPRQQDPRRQADNHAYYLKQFLDDQGLNNIKINKVLVFPHDKVEWEKAPGVFIIKNKETLRKYMEDLSHDQNCTIEMCERIKDLLRPLSL